MIPMNRLTLLFILSLLTSKQNFGETVSILDIDSVPAAGETQLWSPLFQASWDKLQAIQNGALEKVVPPNAQIQKLEQFQWNEESVMPAGAYAVYGGRATEEFSRQTATAIQKAFNFRIDPRQIPINPLRVATYGILIREVQFQNKFFRSRNQGLLFQPRAGPKQLCTFFGTAGEQSDMYRKAVQILRYEVETGAFILKVSTTTEGESLIIALPESEQSFRSAVELVRNAEKSPLSGAYGYIDDSALHREDVVKIPYLNLEAQTDFSGELSGELYYTEKAQPWLVTTAFQAAKLELFESGARVRVQAVTGFEPFGPPPEPPAVVPREFICDRPFFVFLWRDDAEWPYLAAWIDGADCLTPFAQ